MRKLFSNWMNLGSHAGAMLMAPSILAIGIMAFSYFSWNRQMIEEAPMLDVVMEIKVELERTHMHLHEFERGLIIMRDIKDPVALDEVHDQVIFNVDHTIESLGNLNTHIGQLLSGTSSMGDVTLSHLQVKKSTDPELNWRLEALQAAIITLSDYMLPRIKGDNYQTFIYDSENDMMFDVAQEFAQAADDRVHEIIGERLTMQRRVFLLSMVFFALMTVFFFTKWKKLKDRHNSALANLYLTLQATEQSDEIVIIADSNGVIDYVNQRFVEITGYSSDEIMLQKLSVLDDGAMMNEALPDMLLKKKWQRELSCKDKHGKSYRSLTTISAIVDRSDNVAYCEVRQNLL